MKTPYIYTLSLLSLLSFSLVATFEEEPSTIESVEEEPVVRRQEPVLEYPNEKAFVTDFLDVKKKTEKTMAYWLGQLIMLCKINKRLTPLQNDLIREARTKQRNAKKVALLFVKHQNTLPPDASEYVKNLAKRSPSTLLSTIKKRLET